MNQLLRRLMIAMAMAMAPVGSGCDSAAQRPDAPLKPAAASIDWSKVQLHTSGREAEMLWGLIRELDVQLKGSSGELMLYWSEDNAIVSKEEQARIERYWAPDAEEDQLVTPELWKSVVWFLGQNSSGQYHGRGLGALAFLDGRGETRNTEWTITPVDGPDGAPALMVEWWRPISPDDW